MAQGSGPKGRLVTIVATSQKGRDVRNNPSAKHDKVMGVIRRLAKIGEGCRADQLIPGLGKLLQQETTGSSALARKHASRMRVHDRVAVGCTRFKTETEILHLLLQLVRQSSLRHHLKKNVLPHVVWDSLKDRGSLDFIELRNCRKHMP